MASRRRRRILAAAAAAAPVLALTTLATTASVIGADRAQACDYSAGAVTASAWRVPVATTYVAASTPTTLFLTPTGPQGAPAATDALALGAVTVAAATADSVTLDAGGGLVITYAGLHPAATRGAMLAVGQPVGSIPAGGRLLVTATLNNASTDPTKWLQTHGITLDGTQPPPPVADATGATSPDGEGGSLSAFALPTPGDPRKDSIGRAPSPIPADVAALYQQAGARYGIPWALVAGIGQEETDHGRNTATSSAGAQGLMQFTPATFATQGVDGDGDGRADITNPADSIHSAAHYLVTSGVKAGPDGVKKALRAYNHADWYVNDVLYYAAAYGGGHVTGGTDPNCAPGTGDSGTSIAVNVPANTPAAVASVLGWATTKRGLPYIFGGNGPNGYDCSSFTLSAYATAGVNMPRTAAAQRSWLASGKGTRIQPGQEQPGDLIFWDSYLGPGQIGHVVMVLDPAQQLTIEASQTCRGGARPGIDHCGIGSWSYATRQARSHIYEIWRPHLT